MLLQLRVFVGVGFAVEARRDEHLRRQRLAFGMADDRIHHLHAHLGALLQQHVQYCTGGIVAEQLALTLVVVCNLIALHQLDEIPLGVTAQCRFTKMWM